MNKMDLLRATIHTSNTHYNIIIITETWANENVTDTFLNIDGYTAFRHDRLNKRGGGVIVYCDTVCYPVRINLKSTLTWCNCVVCKCWNNIFVVSFYRPPSSSNMILAAGLHEIHDIILEIAVITKHNEHLFISGDFNLPDVNWGDPGENNQVYLDLMTLLCTLRLRQYVNFSTRLNNILDLFFASKNLRTCAISRISPLGNSDHVVLIISISLPGSLNHDRYAICKQGSNFNFKKTDWDLFNALLFCSLNSVDINEWKLLNVNELSLVIQDHIQAAIATSTPVIRHRNKHSIIRNHQAGRRKCNVSPVPWITDECVAAIRRKNWLYNKWKRYNCATLKLSYNSASNNCKRVIQKAKITYDNSIAAELVSSSSNRKFWEFVKYRLSGNNNSTISGTFCNTNGVRVHDPTGIANLFNCYFASVFRQDVNNDSDLEINTGKPVYNQVTYDCSKAENVTSYEIYQIIRKIKPSTSCGFDNIPNIILKKSAHYLCDYLEILFKKILTHGSLPDCWRTAKIIPIFKKGDRNFVSNYRPISLLSSISKVMEALIANRIRAQLDANKFFSSKQFGFRTNHSTSSNLTLFTKHVTKSLEDKNFVHAIYIDLSKAFDSVWHRGLLFKLRQIGIDDLYVNFIENYLSNRKQIVSINGFQSDTAVCSSGVPQGSILGPLLFIIYINDAASIFKDSSCLMFADDVKVYKEISILNYDKDFSNLQDDIDNFHAWCTCWKLSVNYNKCAVMIFSSQGTTPVTRTVAYKIGGITLSHTNKICDLGVLFNNRLCFRDHIIQCTTKAKKMTYMIHKSFNFTDLQHKRLLYSTFVRPHVEYATSVWNPTSKSDITLLESVQRFATRLMLPNQRGDHLTRYKRCGLLSLERRRFFFDCCLIFRLIHENNSDLTLGDFSIDLSHSLLNKYNLAQAWPGSKIARREFSYRIIAEWNSLPSKIKCIDSFAVFRKAILSFLMETIC